MLACNPGALGKSKHRVGCRRMNSGMLDPPLSEAVGRCHIFGVHKVRSISNQKSANNLILD